MSGGRFGYAEIVPEPPEINSPYSAPRSPIQRYTPTALVIWTIIGLLLSSIFGILLFWISQHATPTFPSTKLILISLDGFRPEYLNRGLTPTLQWLQRNGLSTNYMIPQFPTKTFPNHYTIVTGLYPESHGIVSNEFYDPLFGEYFDYHNETCNLDPKWWLGEPIWTTAERNQIKSAICFWPGSEAPHENILPFRYLEYSKMANQMSTKDRMQWVLDTMFKEPEIGFYAVYLSAADSAGHRYGPDSQEVNDAIQELDDGLRYLLTGLRSQAQRFNLIVLSDHGMLQLDPNKIILTDDFNQNYEVMVFGSSPVLDIIPKNQSQLENVYQKLNNFASQSGNWHVYKKSEIPSRFHYQNSQRISPMIAMADPPYSFANSQQAYKSKGSHGYDNQYADMHSIFIAFGSSFKPHSWIEPFSNTEVYQLLTFLLDISPSKNNGTQSGLSLFLSQMKL